jgi:hypothetical protein
MAFDDLQIDAHGFTTLCCHTLACLPFFSANLLCHEIVFVHGVIGKGGVEEEWPMFDFERYWKVTALGNGSLKLAVSDETPGAGLWEGRKGNGQRDM